MKINIDLPHGFNIVFCLTTMVITTTDNDGLRNQEKIENINNVGKQVQRIIDYSKEKGILQVASSEHEK